MGWRRRIFGLGIFLGGSCVGEPLVDLDPFPVHADARARVLLSGGIRTGDVVWDRLSLGDIPFTTWENLWRGHPSMDTFRRSDSRTAHPTTQGVRLRPLATNAASRTLVLLDQLPLNDPFGGWVYTQHLFLRAWDEVRLASAGRAALWGSPGFGGVVLLQPAARADTGSYLTGAVGSQDRREIEGGASFALSEAIDASIQLRQVEDQGFFTLGPEDRGPIDSRANLSLWSAKFRVGSSIENQTPTFGENRTGNFAWEAGWRGWGEKRGNGTLISKNRTDANDVWFKWSAGNAGGRFSGSIFRQWRRFENVFSSATPDRQRESPALDQFGIPAFSTGGSIIWESEARARTPSQDSIRPPVIQIGADTREARAVVRERYLFTDGILTRLREAGGKQHSSGIFGHTRRTLQDGRWEIGMMMRLDHHRLRDGFRRETVIDSGEKIREEHHTDRRFHELSANAELRWHPSTSQFYHLALHRGHRLPTLNELYRPYRVRNDIVEANPDLRPERGVGIQVGGNWHSTEKLNLSVAVWYQALDRMVANVVLAEGPGTDPVVGFIPAGGTGAQRLPVSGNHAYGAEWQLSGRVTERMDIQLTFATSRTRFGKASKVPEFGGDSFPLSPRHQFRGHAILELHPTVRAGVAARIQSRAMEDGGRAELPSMATADLHLSWSPSYHTQLQVLIENVFDSEIVTAQASDGLRSIGATRNLMIRMTVVF